MKKVLIVDDDPAILEIVSELVADAGFDPVTAQEGEEGLEIMREEEPDLALLDLKMPGIDGWTVLKRMKEEDLTKVTKVMMLTATEDVGTDIFGLQDVVIAYIRKPFDGDELIEKLTDELTPPQEEERREEMDVGLFERIREMISPHSEVPGGMEKLSKSDMRYNIREGFGYVIKERKPVESFEIFVDQVTHNIQGLCITRQHPSVVRSKWGLEKTPIIWLSNKLGKVYLNPSNIGILSDTIVRFVEKSGESVVMIDGIEFLITNNDFGKVIRMIHHVFDAVMENKSRLIISVDPRTLEQREIALLERNMEVVDTNKEGFEKETLLSNQGSAQ